MQIALIYLGRFKLCDGKKKTAVVASSINSGFGTDRAFAN